MESETQLYLEVVEHRTDLAKGGEEEDTVCSGPGPIGHHDCEDDDPRRGDGTDGENCNDQFFARSRHHFYQPSSGLGLNEEIIGRPEYDEDKDPPFEDGFCLDAASWARNDQGGGLTWTGAIRSYGYLTREKPAAYNRLGHVGHLVGDMAQPDHVHLEPHSLDGSNGIEGWTTDNWSVSDLPPFETLTPARLTRMEQFLVMLAKHTVEMSSYGGNIDSENSEFGSMFDVDDSLTQFKISNKPDQDGKTIGYWDGNYSEDDEVFEVFQVTHTGPRNTFFVETKNDIAKPATYKGIDNPGEQLLNRFYVDELMPEAVEYIAGLYMHFYDVVNHPPILTRANVVQAGACVHDQQWAAGVNATDPFFIEPPPGSAPELSGFAPCGLVTITDRLLEEQCPTQWINGSDGAAYFRLAFGTDYDITSVPPDFLDRCFIEKKDNYDEQAICSEISTVPCADCWEIDCPTTHTATDIRKRMDEVTVGIAGHEIIGTLVDNETRWEAEFVPPADGSLDGIHPLQVRGIDQAPHFAGYCEQGEQECDDFVARDYPGDELDTEPSCLAVAGQNQPYNWEKCPAPQEENDSYVPGSDTNHVLMIDATPPTMALVSAGVDDQNRTVAVYEVSDATSGLEVINVFHALNATVVIDPDPVNPGDKMALVTITVVDRTHSAHVSLQTEDVAGNPYDPSVVIPVLAIKRGPSLPPINPQSQGLTPVAVLSDDDFGPGDLDFSTLAFGPGGSSPELPGNKYNPNRYRNRDLMLNFSTEEAAIGDLDTDACLVGRTLDEAFVVSCQAIRTVGNPGDVADVSDPTPGNECQCVPHKVTPGRNLATLKKTTSLGRGSSQTKKVGVRLKAIERTRGACRPGSSTDTFSLRLHMVDDDGDVILDEIRTGVTCDRRVRQQKFMVTYEVENCAGSEAPSRTSAGEVTVTATTGDGELVASRTLKCKK
jgi:hypothetical protein